MQLTQTREIDGLTVSVSQLPPMRSLRMLNRLRKAIGPAMSKLLSGNTGKLGDMDISRLGDALEALNLPDQELEDITKELLATARIQVDGKNMNMMNGGQFDPSMNGQVGVILKAVGFAIEVNYGSFFGALRALAPNRVEIPSPSQSA